MIERTKYEKSFDDNELHNRICEELKKFKIDINDTKNPYFKRKKYREHFCKTSIGKMDYWFLTYDYYVEKYLVGNAKINSMKIGKFDIGTKKYIPSDALSEKKLFEEIFEELFDDSPEKYLNDGNSDYVKGIRNKFYDSAKKGGIINQLKELYDIDINSFEDEYSKLKFMKLLYYFCKTDRYGEKINLYLLLSKPSLENVDSAYLDYENRNGDSVAYFKNELIKEMDIYDVYIFNYEVIKILNEWEDFLGVSVRYAYNRNIQDLERIAIFLEERIVNLLPDLGSNIQSKCENGIFDTFYLKILQHEYISIKSDFIKINEFTLKSYLHQKRHTECCENIIIKRHLMKSEIKIKIPLLKRVLVYDFDGDEKAVENFVNRNTKKVILIIGWYEEAFDVDIRSKLPFLLIVAAFVAIKDAEDNEESMYYSYYRAMQSGQFMITDKLNGSRKSEELFHRLWARKTHFVYCCLCGYENEMRYAIRIEKALDVIMRFLMVYHNLDDYKKCNQLLFEQVQLSFIRQEIGLYNMNRVADLLNCCNGYMINLYHPNCEKIFRMISKNGDVSGIVENLALIISSLESTNSDKEEHFEIKINNQDGDFWFSGLFKVSIDSNKKILNLIDYHKVVEDEMADYYVSMGLKNFVWSNESEVRENSISKNS